MTTSTDIVNWALQDIGTRTTVTAGELAANSTNEAIQANLILDNTRQSLLRMAPWNFSMKTANLTYITSAPGTPENTSTPPTLWQPGLPPPPWGYEYQFPVDCLRACWIIPNTQTGYAGGVPISNITTGGAPTLWSGPPVRFKIQNDQFFSATAVAIAAGGTGYAVNDIITLETSASTETPQGAPAQVRVLTVNGSGVILTCELVNHILGASPAQSGSYFTKPANPQAQGSTDGSGTGATFNLTYGTKASQRVILTNQEFAILTYCENVTDPNRMDVMFQDAWSNVLGAGICMALTGDKKLANDRIAYANGIIEQARTPDGNEGITVNDVTPDFIRIRGVNYATPYTGPWNTGFDWGGLWPTY